MTADQIFQIANPFALSGWVALVVAVAMKREDWITRYVMPIWPFTLAAVYTALIIFFFFQAPGGFDTLKNVQLLFTSPWAALAGWVHYLAFDLFIGAWISLKVLQQKMPRAILFIILPLTFLFGPIGLLLYGLSRPAFIRQGAPS